MNDIIKVLMERDGLSLEEAEKHVEDTSSRIWDELDYEDCELEDLEDILYGEIGLEPDYLLDILI
jgi:ribosomal protein L7/L12